MKKHEVFRESRYNGSSMLKFHAFTVEPKWPFRGGPQLIGSGLWRFGTARVYFPIYRLREVCQTLQWLTTGIRGLDLSASPRGNDFQNFLHFQCQHFWKSMPLDHTLASQESSLYRMSPADRGYLESELRAPVSRALGSHVPRLPTNKGPRMA